jgi:hypothetical protein
MYYLRNNSNEISQINRNIYFNLNNLSKAEGFIIIDYH